LIELNYARGERAAAGEVQLLIADISKLWVAGELRPQDWELLSVDKELPIEVNVLGLERLGKLVGKQVYVSGKVQPNSGAVRIAVEVDNVERLLRPGMFAQLKFKQPSKEQVRVLPAEAIFTNDGHDFLVVKQGEEQFDVVHVEVGRRSNDFVELLTEIPLDSTIVSKGVMAIASDAILEEE
jgi:multidrug efflux pump subunit AcrA (membrane-fusion protein)